MGTTRPNGVTAKALAVAAVTITMTASTWAAGKEKVLLSFQGPNGGNPTAGLIADAHGNLYGAAADGGKFGFGNVFKLTKNNNGKWTQTVLYSFAGDNASDGQAPLASLLFDGKGNLYGTTGGGGTHQIVGVELRVEDEVRCVRDLVDVCLQRGHRRPEPGAARIGDPCHRRQRRRT